MPVVTDDWEIQCAVKKAIADLKREEEFRLQCKQREQKENLTSLVKDAGVLYAVFVTAVVIVVSIGLLCGACHFSNFWDGVLYTIFMIGVVNYWIR
jgi:hypothetical protein